MINKLLEKLGLRREEDSGPNLSGAYKLANTLCRDFERLTYYISRVEDLKLNDQERNYIEKIEFNLSSLRDDLKISLENKAIQKIRRRIEDARRA